MPMKKIVSSLILAFFVSICAFGQISSPLGVWKLDKHYVSENAEGGMDTKEINLMIGSYNCFLVFTTTELLYIINGDTTRGSWTVSTDRKKYEYKYGEFIRSGKLKEQLNFEEPITIEEWHYPLYKNKNDSSQGGSSIFTRVSGEKPAFDVSSLFGVWKEQEYTIGKRGVNSGRERRIKFNEDYAFEWNYEWTSTWMNTSTWKVNGTMLTITNIANPLVRASNDVTTKEIIEVSSDYIVIKSKTGKKNTIVKWTKQ